MVTRVSCLITFLLNVLVILPSFKAMGQDGVFSQFYASSLYLNPALAGLHSEISLSSNYRLQWLTISPYSLQQTSLIYPFTGKSSSGHHWGAAGISIFQEKSGTSGSFRHKGINFSLAYNLHLSTHKVNFISFGIQGGVGQQQIDPGSYEWGSKYTSGENFIDRDPGNDHILNSKIYPEVNAGAVWYINGTGQSNEKKPSAFLGISCYHLNTPNSSLVEGIIMKIPRLYKLHSGMKIPLSQKFSFGPNVIVATQNNNRQINAGAYFGYVVNQSETGYFANAELIAGSLYRVNDACIFLAGLHSKFFTLGFSYDWNISSLRNYTGGKGAYEISLSLKIPKSLKISRYETPRI